MKYFILLFIVTINWGCNRNTKPVNNEATLSLIDTVKFSENPDILSNGKFTFFLEHEKEILKSYKISSDTVIFWDNVGGDDLPTGQWKWILIFNNSTDFTFEGSMWEEAGLLQVNGEGSLINGSNCAKVLGQISGYDDLGEPLNCNELDSLGLIITESRLFVQFMYLGGAMDQNEVVCDLGPRYGLDGTFTRRKNDYE